MAFQFYTNMQRRGDGQVYADLHKTDEKIYFDVPAAEHAVSLDVATASHRHVVPLVALTEGEYNSLVALYEAVEKLVKAKGRFHTEKNYQTLVEAFNKVEYSK